MEGSGDHAHPAVVADARKGEVRAVITVCEVERPSNVCALMASLFPQGGCPGADTFDGIADAFAMWDQAEQLDGLPSSAR